MELWLNLYHNLLSQIIITVLKYAFMKNNYVFVTIKNIYVHSEAAYSYMSIKCYVKTPRIVKCRC